MIIFEICAFLCIFAPFTFVFCLVSAIKKAVSGQGNELLDGFFAGLSLLVMLAGLIYLV
mgnify:FL=1